MIKLNLLTKTNTKPFDFFQETPVIVVTLVPSWTKISLTHGISSLKKCIKIFLLTWESLVKIAFLLYGGRQFHSVCKMWKRGVNVWKNMKKYVPKRLNVSGQLISNSKWNCEEKKGYNKITFSFPGELTKFFLISHGNWNITN